MGSKVLRIVAKSAQEMKKAGEFLAQEIIRTANKEQRTKNSKIRKKAIIIGLEGELGSGKTTFIQGMAKGLEIKEKITSPTFVIMRRYGWFCHIDCYRLNSPQDLLDLGFKEIISQPNIVVIEWAEKIKKILPKDTFWIKFEYLDKDKRMIAFDPEASPLK